MIKDFKCKRCGKCCYPPKLYFMDILRIKKQGYKEEDFVERDFRGIPYLKEQKNGKCTFLGKNKKISSCKIYQHRPRICRLYPTELVNNSCEPEELAFDKFIMNKINK